jgi:hypothetical protein
MIKVYITEDHEMYRWLIIAFPQDISIVGEPAA